MGQKVGHKMWHKSLKLTLMATCVVLTACQTTSKEVVKVASNDGLEVQENKYEPEEAAQKRLALGLQYIEKGLMERGRMNLVMAYEHAPKMPDVLYGLAYYYQQVLEFETADEYYRKVLKEAPRNPDYLNAYGVFLCQSKKDYLGGVEYFLKAVEQPKYTMVGAAYENAGFCSLRGGQHNNALEYFDKALTFNPSLINSLFGKASTYYESGNYSRAENTLRRFEGQSRATPESLLLGYQISRQLNDSMNMRSYGDKLMQLFPNSDAAQTYLRTK